jgi:hypothetical protein
MREGEASKAFSFYAIGVEGADLAALIHERSDFGIGLAGA